MLVNGFLKLKFLMIHPINAFEKGEEAK